MSSVSALYVGQVKHHRFRPRPHGLAYRVYWMLIDLDELATLASRLRCFSHNGFNLYAFHDKDYGDRSGRPLRPQIEAILDAAGIDCDGGPIRLLTMPRILGYAFNPISTYFCYRPDGQLRATVYEVHNTFGEIHTYVAPADPNAPIQQQAVGKALHVSPFMGLTMHYGFRVRPPGERVSIAIDGHDEGGRLITATLNGERAPVSDPALLRLLASHPLVTLKVTAAIHWHALRLLAKRIPFWPHPAPPDRAVSLGHTVSAPSHGAHRS